MIAYSTCSLCYTCVTIAYAQLETNRVVYLHIVLDPALGRFSNALKIYVVSFISILFHSESCKLEWLKLSYWVTSCCG